MFGAIIGDIVGSPYEFACSNGKSKDFPLFFALKTDAPQIEKPAAIPAAR